MNMTDLTDEELDAAETLLATMEAANARIAIDRNWLHTAGLLNRMAIEIRRRRADIKDCDRTNAESLAEIQRLEGEAIIAADHIKGAEAAIERLVATNGDLRCRWQHAEPFVSAGIDLYNEALESSFLDTSPNFTRRTVTAALAPAMNGLMALHETFSDDEIDAQLRAAGGDPKAIGERGKTKILALMQKLREARR